MKKLIGPFHQILPMTSLPLKGALADEKLGIIEHGGVVVENEKIIAVGPFMRLQKDHSDAEDIIMEEPMVLLPGFIDCHTHICWAGTRAADYAQRMAGKTYLEIAKQGGGIWSTVQHTRNASIEQLVANTAQRADQQMTDGITTVEVKSGYGLNSASELNILRAIDAAQGETLVDLIPTCLAAHTMPQDFEGSRQEYLDEILNYVLFKAKNEGLTQRVDIFVEDTAFSVDDALYFLPKAKAMGFDITVHADQFSTGGSQVAIDTGALAAEHLEASDAPAIAALAKSNVIPVVLPGASLGLGLPFAPAREMLDAGCSLAIASDWNPGSAPHGGLLTQAAFMGAAQRLSLAEVFAGITFRAAAALGLKDRGTLAEGTLADMVAFSCEDYREIMWQQGRMKPTFVWKRGEEPVLDDLKEMEDLLMEQWGSSLEGDEEGVNPYLADLDDHMFLLPDDDE